MLNAVVAAGEAPDFLGEISVLVVGGALVAYVAFRMGLVPIIGFLFAGILIGPSQLGIISDRDLVDAAAEIGVILLLFTIGLEFSLDRLARLSRLIFGGGGLQVALATAATTGVLVLAGVGMADAVFTGLLVALSSTAIVLKLLADRAESNVRHGQVALGFLLFQDLAIVGMVLVVPVLGGDGGGSGEILAAFGIAVAIVLGVVLIARRLMPPLLEVVARTCSPEVFLLSVIAICFGTAYGTSLAGVSVSLGAFLAGLLVSESRYDQQALGDVLPLQIIFSALFFVSVGMLLDLGFLFDNLWVIAGAVLAVVALKVLTTAAAARALGERPGVAVAGGLLLAQVGEFSFVLESVGRESGLSPAGLGADGSQGFIAVVVLLMIATPWLASSGVALGRRVDGMGGEPRPRVHEASEPAGDAPDLEQLSDHILVSGYGRWARQLTAILQRDGIPVVVITLSPEGATEAERRGLPVVLGDSTRSATLRAAGVDRAQHLLVLDDTADHAARIAGVVRALNPKIEIVVRTPRMADTAELSAAGADHVVSEEAEASAHLTEKLLDRYLVPGAKIESHLVALRAARPQLDAADGRFSARVDGRTVVDTDAVVHAGLDPDGCAHAPSARDVVPSAPGCEECLREGGRWVHLRVCMGCGHVGCCDSSPGRHARQHGERAGHPVMRSAEPGETWGWCFEDDQRLEPAPVPAPA